jgi:hypothetical protein
MTLDAVGDAVLPYADNDGHAVSERRLRRDGDTDAMPADAVRAHAHGNAHAVRDSALRTATNGDAVPGGALRSDGNTDGMHRRGARDVPPDADAVPADALPGRRHPVKTGQQSIPDRRGHGLNPESRFRHSPDGLADRADQARPAAYIGVTIDGRWGQTLMPRHQSRGESYPHADT